VQGFFQDIYRLLQIPDAFVALLELFVDFLVIVIGDFLDLFALFIAGHKILSSIIPDPAVDGVGINSHFLCNTGC